jgi:hypothetical protein
MNLTKELMDELIGFAKHSERLDELDADMQVETVARIAGNIHTWVGSLNLRAVYDLPPPPKGTAAIEVTAYYRIFIENLIISSCAG